MHPAAALSRADPRPGARRAGHLGQMAALGSYIAHVHAGLSLRNVARLLDCTPSTVLRRVRRIEARRDDPLFDEALECLASEADHFDTFRLPDRKDKATMFDRSHTSDVHKPRRDEALIHREALRVLRRLDEPEALLAIAPGMDKGAVLRPDGSGGHQRTAVVARDVVHVFALREWIARDGGAKVACYRLTAPGRTALKRLRAEAAQARRKDDGGNAFGEAHRDWDTREMPGIAEGARRTLQVNTAESPLGILARRRDKDGKPFLTPEMVLAGERLREDFELAQLGPRITQNWDRFLTVGGAASGPREGAGSGAMAARARLAEAMAELGPGLSDVAMRCCCFLEGLEAAEQRLGWSARSGKIVLRIALLRLARHYEQRHGTLRPMIG